MLRVRHRAVIASVLAAVVGLVVTGCSGQQATFDGKWNRSDEVITDVNRRRVMVRAHDDSFTIAWDYPGRTLLEVRILRSSEGPAESADDGLGQGQELVYEDVTGSFRDAGLLTDRSYFYTVFARHPGEAWVLWGDYPVPARSEKVAQGQAAR